MKKLVLNGELVFRSPPNIERKDADEDSGIGNDSNPSH